MSEHDSHMSVMTAVTAACDAERFPVPGPEQALAEVGSPPRVIGAVRSRLAATLGIQLTPTTVLNTRLTDLPNAPRSDVAQLGDPSLAQAARWRLDMVDARNAAASQRGGGGWFGCEGQLAYTGHRVRGPFDPEALLRACVHVAGRHEALLSSFPGPADPTTGAPAVSRCAQSQVVKAVSMAPASARTDPAAIVDLLTAPMDLARGPLFRVMVVPVGPQEWLICWAFERIVFDGMSIHIWNQEVAACYAAEVAGQPSELPALPCQYYDHAAWQRAELAGGRADTLVAQWEQDLAGRPVYPPVGMLGAAPQAGEGQLVTAHVDVHAEQHSLLATRTARTGSTPFLVWLAALARALHALTNQRNVGVVTPTVGRTTEESGQLIGLFANLSVAWFTIDDNEPFENTLRAARLRAVTALERDILPFSELVRAFCPEYLDGRTPDPYCFLNVVTSDQARGLSLAGVETTRVALPRRAERKRYPGLDVVAVDFGDRWRLTGASGDDTSTRSQIEELLDHTVRQAIDWAGGSGWKPPARDTVGHGSPDTGPS